MDAFSLSTTKTIASTECKVAKTGSKNVASGTFWGNSDWYLSLFHTLISELMNLGYWGNSTFSWMLRECLPSYSTINLLNFPLSILTLRKEITLHSSHSCTAPFSRGGGGEELQKLFVNILHGIFIFSPNY